MIKGEIERSQQAISCDIPLDDIAGRHKRPRACGSAAAARENLHRALSRPSSCRLAVTWHSPFQHLEHPRSQPWQH